MRKIVPLLVVGFLILSGFGAVGLQVNKQSIEINRESEIKKENFKLDFDLEIAKPAFKSQDEFVTIELEESKAFMSRTGEPMLPVISKTFDFPVGTKISNVNVDISWERYDLNRKVTPTPIIAPQSAEIDPEVARELKINEEIYSNAELFPSEPYKYRTGSGIKDMEHVVFLNVKCFPQYSPANNYVKIPTKIDIDVEYETRENFMQNEDQYDLIIITHNEFVDELQPLVDHKELMGVTTKMVTVNEIYEDYEGVADWEEIKMYLADHVIDWDTKYVLLAGGRVGQTNDWYVPDFRSNCWNPADAYDPPYDQTYSSDLYFADVYYVNQFGNHMMDDWDSNDNGIYAEGPDLPSGTDQMDFYPDVHLGRIPIRYDWEAEIAVNKIINYENNADDSWFKTAVLAGGDGFPPERYGNIADPDAWEGEIVCDEFADLLANRGVVSTKAYCSDQGDIQVDEAEDVYNEISKGCGFAHLTGHANPFVLGSYTPGTGITPPPLVPFYTGFNAIQYDCEGKLPFMICEGCHNAQFDVTGQRFIEYLFEENPDFIVGRFTWIPHDVSSWFVVQEGGGAIAVIGNTALGLGGLNYGTTEFVGGWIMLRFAEAWGVDGKDHTGSVWTVGINGYIDNFDVFADTGDRKTIEERVLLGDPSIKLGGYGTLSESDEPDDDEGEYGPVSISTPTWAVGDSWTYTLDNIDIDLTPIEGRSLRLKLSTNDINIEVTGESDGAYTAAITSEDTDVTFGGMFDFKIEGEEEITIPTISLSNINLNGEINYDKDTLGILNADIGMNIELIDNLENIEDILDFEFPNIVYTLRPIMSIPADINLNLEFDDPFNIMQFPIENENTWGIPANQVTVSIDGSVESIWLRILNFVNRFIEIVPQDLAQYLPDIDISELLNDQGIDTIYDIDIPEIPSQIEETPVFEVRGSTNIDTPAGSFDAAKVSLFEDNGIFYYAESENNLVKMIGHTKDYIPIIENINLELKE